MAKPAETLFPAYNEKDMASLKQRFTPEQVASIEAAQAAISPEDLKLQARMRRDTHQLRYIDDFAVTLPMLDREPEKPWEIARPGTDWQEEHELDFEKGFAEKLEDMRQANEAQVARKLGKFELTDEEAANAHRSMTRLDHFKLMDGLVGPSAMAPGTYDYEGEEERRKEREKSEEQKKAEEMKEKSDPGGKMEKAAKEVGLDEVAMKFLKHKVLLNKNVTNVTPLGKVVSTFVMYMVGTGNGRLGIGQAKGLDANETLRQARLRAIRGLRPVPRYEERTIFGDVQVKIAATVVKLSARPPGKLTFISYFQPSTDYGSRIRSPLSTLHLRNRPRSRYPRPRGPSTPISNPYEHYQGHL